MRRQLLAALLMWSCSPCSLRLAFPLVVTGVAQVAFNDKADGSLVERRRRGRRVVPHRADLHRAGVLPPRPSAAGDGYDASAELRSNLGPDQRPKLLVGEKDDPATDERRTFSTASSNGPTPTARRTASTPTPRCPSTPSPLGSGPRPDISVANARLQAPRVADERGLDLDTVLDLVDDHTRAAPSGSWARRESTCLSSTSPSTRREVARRQRR